MAQMHYNNFSYLLTISKLNPDKKTHKPLHH